MQADTLNPSPSVSIRQAAEAVIYRASECGLLSHPMTDLQIALLYLQAALTQPQPEAPASLTPATAQGKGVE